MSFDCEQLIEEVEKHPTLYDHSLKDYHDKIMKRTLWEEVCSVIVEDWSVLGEVERSDKCVEIQGKWKNLKDTFRKELNLQKKGLSPRKTKRKYIYYDKMTFLIPVMLNSETSSSRDPLELPSDIHIEAISEAAGAQSQVVFPPRPKRAKRPPLRTPEQETVTVLNDTSRNEDIDEEKNFAMSLVPSLRKLDDDQKDWAKIEILNVLRKARYMNFHPLHQQCGHQTIFRSDNPTHHTNANSFPGSSSLYSTVCPHSAVSHPQRSPSVSSDNSDCYMQGSAYESFKLPSQNVRTD